MNIQEMSTAVQYHLPVKVFILNNQYMGMVRQWQELFHGNRLSESYTESLPDFVKLADAYGGTGMICEDPDALDDAIRELIATPGPVLFDCRVANLANCFPMIPSGKAHNEMLLGEDVSDATLVCISGRYEFHNKGVDVVLDALGEMNRREGPRAVLYILVPAGNSGIRSEVLERRGQSVDELDGPVGIATHNLFDEEHDPVQAHCQRAGLDNAAGSRIKVIHVPIYLGRHDGFLHHPYEAVVRAMDLSMRAVPPETD